MKTNLLTRSKMLTAFFTVALIGLSAQAQTSVYDIIAGSPNHTTLEAAINDAGLNTTLDDLNNEFTVFAPDDAAFNAFFNETGLTANDLLNDPNLSDILLYHVLDIETASTAISNGDIVTPLNTANTLKLTVDGNMVYANQAMVNAADLPADNGIVHSVNAVLLSNETVADVAIDNGFTTLTAAVIEARLLPALTDPLDTMTVFAPSDAAFTESLNDLGISAGDLLASPDLADILLYHVLGFEVVSGDLSNGAVATPLNTANTIKFTITGNGNAFANQAPISMVDVQADNGVVHAIDEVIFTNETVVDAAINNGFNILTAAVITAELLPALTDPFEEYTVFAPTDAAFNQFLSDQGISAQDLLADPNLADILLYHTLGSEVLAADLTNGPATTLNGDDVVIDLSNGVMVNNTTVVTADVDVDNGVVHAIDYVLDPSTADIEDLELEAMEIYPNPTNSVLNVNEMNGADYSIVNMAGKTVISGTISTTSINVEDLKEGTYFINISNENTIYRSRFIKM